MLPAWRCRCRFFRLPAATGGMLPFACVDQGRSAVGRKNIFRSAAIRPAPISLKCRKVAARIFSAQPISEQRPPRRGKPLPCQRSHELQVRKRPARYTQDADWLIAARRALQDFEGDAASASATLSSSHVSSITSKGVKHCEENFD